MARTNIAEDLVEFMRSRAAAYTPGHPGRERADRAAQQLRGLLAVAGAARRFRSLDPMAQALLLGEDNALDRALARLARASGLPSSAADPATNSSHKEK